MSPISTTLLLAAAAGFANLAAGSPTAGGPPKPAWTLTPTQSPQRFRGRAPVSASTAWVAGTNGTILRTEDGATWGGGPETPVPAAHAAQGVFSVRFRDAARRAGRATGPSPGTRPTRSRAATGPARPGSRGSALPGEGRRWRWDRRGPTLRSGGRTWHGFEDGSFDAVECVGGRVCWASGEKGRVARLVFRSPSQCHVPESYLSCRVMVILIVHPILMALTNHQSCNTQHVQK